MNNVVYRVLADIGLIGWPPVFRDRWFVVALFSAFPVWVVLWFSVIPTFDIDDHSLAGVLVLSVIWYPVLEEVLFRGIVQGAIFYRILGRQLACIVVVRLCAFLVSISDMGGPDICSLFGVRYFSRQVFKHLSGHLITCIL